MQTNWLAIFLAAVASMIVGYVWYGPLFGKTWMKLTGKKEMGDKSQMPKTYTIMFIGSLVSAYVLSALGADLMMAFWIWLGFQATLLLSSVLFEGKSWNLYYLNAGYQLASILSMAWVLSYFK